MIVGSYVQGPKTSPTGSSWQCLRCPCPQVPWLGPRQRGTSWAFPTCESWPVCGWWTLLEDSHRTCQYPPLFPLIRLRNPPVLKPSSVMDSFFSVLGRNYSTQTDFFFQEGPWSQLLKGFETMSMKELFRILTLHLLLKKSYHPHKFIKHNALSILISLKNFIKLR